MHPLLSLLDSITLFKKFLNISLSIGNWITCAGFDAPWPSEVSVWVNSSDWRVKRCRPLSVFKCTDELVNIPQSDRLHGGEAPLLYDHVDQGTWTGAGFGGGRVYTMGELWVEVCVWHITWRECASLCSHYVAWFGLKSFFFQGFLWCTQAQLCVRVCAFACLCVCACLVFVRGYKGTLAPGSQPRMNGLSSIIVWGSSGADWGWRCLGGKRSVGWGGADGACRSCIPHPWQRSGVIPFCIHLTVASDSVVDPGLIKTSGFWQLREGGGRGVCSRWAKGGQGVTPRTKAKGATRALWAKGPPDLSLFAFGIPPPVNRLPPHTLLGKGGGHGVPSLLIWWWGPYCWRGGRDRLGRTMCVIMGKW